MGAKATSSRRRPAGRRPAGPRPAGRRRPAQRPGAAAAGGIVYRPLTPARWRDVERLFGVRGACAGCWCMYWRTSARDYRLGKGNGNRRAFRRLVTGGAAHGVIAYSGGEPVGWCSYGPRLSFPRLAGSKILAPLDDAPVWSIVCFFITSGHRRRGLSVGLLEAAA